MNDVDKYCYTTIDSIKEWQRKIESFSGIECLNIRGLPKNASHNDFLKAKEDDSLWFEGFINDLQNLI